MEEFNPNKLTDEQLRLCVNLYYKKWRAKHKDLVSCANIEYYKKCKGIKTEIVKGSVDVNNIALQSII